jgi:hypothetical protein
MKRVDEVASRVKSLQLSTSTLSFASSSTSLITDQTYQTTTMSEEDPIHQFFTPQELENPYALYTALSLTPSTKPEAQAITPADIRTSYRRAALKYHPDKHASKDEAGRKEMERQFQRVGFAFAVLSDEARRRR